MSYLSPEIMIYLKYISPPIVGAFIGYSTNYIAIKMLFRPLTAWKLGKFRVPMTPGVIPSKRFELAENMGEVVGDHLLTSVEIGKGLQHETFQGHISTLIGSKVETLMQRDLGTLASMIPAKFRIYFDIARKTFSYQIKVHIRTFIGSDIFRQKIELSLDSRLDHFLASEVRNVISGLQRDKLYQLTEANIIKILESDAVGQWVEDLVHHKIFETLQKEKSLIDILPDGTAGCFEAMVVKQTPIILHQLASIISEPGVRKKIVKGVCLGIESFISSLGAMADLARGFLRMENMEAIVHSFLVEKKDEIVLWMQSPAIQAKVEKVLKERIHDLLGKPLTTLIDKENNLVVEKFCADCTGQILIVLRSAEVSGTLVSIIKSAIENHIDSDNPSVQKFGSLVFGDKALLSAKEWFKEELIKNLQSPDTLETVDALIDVLINAVLQKRWGKMAQFIPPGVKEGIVESLRKVASTMLASEVPGLVESLNIRRIVAEKINSLDVLRVERLLLTIMEDQFKYINLFGALLGFIIGCANILLL